MTKNAAWKNTFAHLDGGACLNKRTIETACVLFDGSRPATRRTLGFAELMEALWFLELTIVSNNITFDGTLPQSDLASLAAQVEAIASQIGLREDEIAPITAKPKEKRAFMRAAAQQALLDLRPDSVRMQASSGLDSTFDDDDATEFFEHLRRLNGSLSDDRREITHDRLDYLAGDNPVRGGKCLAGLGLVGRSATEFALGLANRLAVKPGLAMAMLINRFRFSYVRQLAFGVRDVYVPAARWRSLSEAHALTFAEVVRRSLENKMASDLKRDLEEQVADSDDDGDPALLSLPPIGLHALMTAPANAKPHDIARTARQRFEEYGRLFRHFWRSTRKVQPPAGGWTAIVGDQALDGEHERIERELTDMLGKLDQKAARNASLVDRFLAPVIVPAAGAASGLASYSLAAEQDTAAIALQAGAVSAAVGAIIGGAGRSITLRMHGHIDEYRKLETVLRASQADLRFDRLANRVQQIFGRELVIGSAR